MNERTRWKPQPATLISLLALFVALGGTAFAAGLAKNSVKSKHIKDGQVKTGDLADGSVSTAKIVNNAITTALLADASVTTAKIGDSAVNSAKVAADSLVAGDLANNSVEAAEIANNAVDDTAIANNTIDGGEVIDGGLSDIDVGNASGTFVYDAPSVAANQCDVQAVTTAGVDNNDHVVVTPPAAIMDLNVSVTAGRALSDGFIRLNICNPTGAAINPPSATYSFLTINQ